jgi:hypothetical protein
MDINESRTRKYLIVWIICIICFVILFFETINHRLYLNDFRVYYEATKALLTGSQVYGIPFGLDTGMFKYSPFVLFLFIPFASIPFTISGILYFLIITTLLVMSFLLCRSILVTNLFQNRKKGEALFTILALVFICNHLYRELHLGNTNIILIFLFLTSLKLILDGKEYTAGILFGIALLLKPYLLLLGIVLLFHKKWRVIAGTSFMIILQGIIMILSLGFTKSLNLHAEWISTMITHSGSYGSNNNIAFLLHTLFNTEISATNNLMIIAVSALLISGFVIYNLELKSGKPTREVISRKNFIFEWFIAAAALPSIVNTDTQHFMYSLPLIMLILFYFAQNPNYMLGIVLFVIFLLYGTNSNDLVGDTIGNFFDRIGAVGISNIMIILVTVYISIIEKRKDVLYE